MNANIHVNFVGSHFVDRAPVPCINADALKTHHHKPNLNMVVGVVEFAIIISELEKNYKCIDKKQIIQKLLNLGLYMSVNFAIKYGKQQKRVVHAMNDIV